MKFIPIDEVLPGTQLLKAICDINGRILFPAGEILSMESIQQLRKLEIFSILGVLPDKTPRVIHVSELQAEAEFVDPAQQPRMDLAEDLSSFVPEYLPADVAQKVEAITSRRFAKYDLTDPYHKALHTISTQQISMRLLDTPLSEPGGGVRLPQTPVSEKPAPVSMQTLMEKNLSIGTLPIIFHNLVEIINNPHASATDVAKVIATDPALSAKLLKLVNSPFYGMPTQIDTVSRAVPLVGTGQLLMLAMGATLMTAFKGIPGSLVDMQTFWNHSIACGVVARLFAVHCNLPNPESFFIAGLLHDIGKLVIYSQLSNHALYIIKEAKNNQCCTHSLEKDNLGFTHAELGAQLLQEWHCPPELIQQVQNHHLFLPENSNPEQFIIPVANLFIQLLDYGSSNSDTFIDPIPPHVWPAMHLVPEDLPITMQELQKKLQGVQALFSSSTF